jgi:hypothetical protein
MLESSRASVFHDPVYRCTMLASSANVEARSASDETKPWASPEIVVKTELRKHMQCKFKVLYEMSSKADHADITLSHGGRRLALRSGQ